MDNEETLNESSRSIVSPWLLIIIYLMEKKQVKLGNNVDKDLKTNASLLK